jgi:hypothetical protein
MTADRDDSFRVTVWLLALALAACAALTGCASTKAEQREEQRQREESWTFEVPIPLLAAEGWRIQPITVTGRRTITETRTGQVTAKTSFSAPELAGALAATLRQAFPALGAIMAPPAPPSGGLPESLLWGPAGIGATGIAWALAKFRRDKTDVEWERERKEAETKAELAGYHRGRAEALQAAKVSA